MNLEGHLNGRKIEPLAKMGIWILSLILTFLGGYYSDRALSADVRSRDLSRLEAHAERLKAIEDRLNRIEGKVDQLIMDGRIRR